MDYEMLKPFLIVLILGFVIGMQGTLTYFNTPETAFAGRWHNF